MKDIILFDRGNIQLAIWDAMGANIWKIEKNPLLPSPDLGILIYLYFIVISFIKIGEYKNV